MTQQDFDGAAPLLKRRSFGELLVEAKQQAKQAAERANRTAILRKHKQVGAEGGGGYGKAKVQTTKPGGSTPRGLAGTPKASPRAISASPKAISASPRAISVSPRANTPSRSTTARQRLSAKLLPPKLLHGSSKTLLHMKASFGSGKMLGSSRGSERGSAGSSGGLTGLLQRMASFRSEGNYREGEDPDGQRVGGGAQDTSTTGRARTAVPADDEDAGGPPVRDLSASQLPDPTSLPPPSSPEAMFEEVRQRL